MTMKIDKFPVKYPFVNRFGHAFTEVEINQLVKHGYGYIIRKGRTIDAFNFHLATALLKILNDYDPKFMVSPSNLLFLFLKYKMKKFDIHGERRPNKCKNCTLENRCRKCSMKLQVISLSEVENFSTPVRDREFTFDEVMYKDFIHHIDKTLGKFYVDVFRLRYMEKTFSEIAEKYKSNFGGSMSAAEKAAQRALIRVQDEWEVYVNHG